MTDSDLNKEEEDSDDSLLFKSKLLSQAYTLGWLVSVCFILGGIYMYFTNVKFQGYSTNRGMYHKILIISGPGLIGIGLSCMLLMYFLKKKTGQYE